MSDAEVKSQLPDLICRAWTDPAFRERLAADSDAVLREAGISLGKGVKVTFHIDSAMDKHFVVPTVPDLSGVDDELRRLIAEHAASPCTRTWGGGCEPD